MWDMRFIAVHASFVLCLNNATLWSYSQDLTWLDHGGGLNMAVANIALKDKFFPSGREGRGQKEERVIEDGLCYNKWGDDLIRIYLHQHSPPVPQTSVWRSDREDVYQYLQLTLTQNLKSLLSGIAKAIIWHTKRVTALQKVPTKTVATDDQQWSCCQFCNLFCKESSCFDLSEY